MTKWYRATVRVERVEHEPGTQTPDVARLAHVNASGLSLDAVLAEVRKCLEVTE